MSIPSLLKSLRTFFLGLALVAYGCSGSGESTADGSAGESSGRRGGNASPAARNYKAHCSMCHGGAGEGVTPLGPDLRDKAEHWNAEELVKYMRDPAGYAKTVDRLGARLMPALASNITDEDAKELAEHVLGFMQ